MKLGSLIRYNYLGALIDSALSFSSHVDVCLKMLAESLAWMHRYFTWLLRDYFLIVVISALFVYCSTGTFGVSNILKIRPLSEPSKLRSLYSLFVGETIRFNRVVFSYTLVNNFLRWYLGNRSTFRRTCTWLEVRIR